MKKAFIGNSDSFDLFLDKNGRTLWSVPKATTTGCTETRFGDKNHVLKLMGEGYFDDTPTESGLELLAGLRSVLYTDSYGNKFSVLRFN